MRDDTHIPADLRIDERELSLSLAELFGIQPERISSMGGYSNHNFYILDRNDRQFVAKVSGGLRSAESRENERRVLSSLEAVGYDWVPRQVHGRMAAGVEGRISVGGSLRPVDLFVWIPGEIDGLWWQQCSPDKIRQVFGALFGLHQAMAGIPGPGAGGLPQRYPGDKSEIADSIFNYSLPATVPASLQATAVGRLVYDSWGKFRESALRLRADILTAFAWESARYQWIHGDVQMENLLFEDGRLTGFLDFERVRWDGREKDAIFSAFRVCKEGPSDGPFRYDEALFETALSSYAMADGGLCESFFIRVEELWKPFFCLDQAMVYLDNAFAGVWQLAEGIGFLPCYNEVLQYGVYA